MSKGSAPRPHDKEAFDKGYERIFKPSKRHVKTPKELFNELVNNDARKKIDAHVLDGIDLQVLSIELSRSIACAMVERKDDAFYVGVACMKVNTQDELAQAFNDKVNDCALEFIKLYQTIKNKD